MDGLNVDINVVFFFWLIFMMFILMLGVDWVYVIGVGIIGDKIVVVVSGLMLGYFVVIFLVVVGVGSLLLVLLVLLNMIVLVGVLYLVWIVVFFFRFFLMLINYVIDLFV